MKITMRPLKGDTFEIEVKPEDKVEDLKKRIAELKADFPAEVQKLIYAGKILADGSSVTEYGIKPSDFVVIMASKAKAPAAPQAKAPAPPADAAPAPAASADATPAPVAQTGAAAAPASTAAPPAAVPIAHVTQLCEMGFPREEVERCLRAAFNNPDRAVEYLTTGIPENVAAPADRSRSPHRTDHGHGHGHGNDAGHGGHQAAGHDCGQSHGDGQDCSGHNHGDVAPSQGQGHGHVATPPATGGGGSGLAFPAMPTQGGGGAGGGGASGALQAIRDNPRFEELRAAVQQNPALLPQLLQGLGREHPELVQAITENQEEFMMMLSGDDDDDGDEGDAHGQEGHGGNVVQVSEADRSAIERLAEMGFSQEAAAQAYLACDRNEELAANLLFDGGMD